MSTEKLIEERWKTFSKEDLDFCFNKYNKKSKSLERATSIDFVPVNEEMKKHLMEHTKMSLSLGVDDSDGKFRMLLVLHNKGEADFRLESKRISGFNADSRLQRGAFDGPDQGAGNDDKHFGVSKDYKDIAIANWLEIPRSGLPDLFYAMDEPTTEVKRIRKFIVPESDLSVLKENLKKGDSLKILFGATYGHVKDCGLIFTPIVQFTRTITAQSEDVSTINIPGLWIEKNNENTIQSTLLDFLRPCPPFGDCD